MTLSQWILLVCLLIPVSGVLSADEAENAYLQKLATLPAQDADAHYGLGCWCNQNGLAVHAREQFEKALALDPEHAGARFVLGYQKVNGKWYKGDAIQIAKGLVHYQGKWVTKEFAENSAKGLVSYQGKWVTLEEKFKAKGYVKYHGTWVSKERMRSIEASQAKARERIRQTSDWANATVLVSQHQHFQFKSNISHDVLADCDKNMELFYQTLSAMFQPPDLKAPIPVEIYATQQQFQAAESAEGKPVEEGVMGYFYWYPDHPDISGIRCFYAGSLDATLSTLFHECTHLIIYKTIGDQLPLWANEGLAVFFESAERTDKGLDVHVVPYERLWSLDDLFKANTVDFDKLADIRTHEDYGIDCYPQGWSLVYYMLYAEKGKYRKAFTNYLIALEDAKPARRRDGEEEKPRPPAMSGLDQFRAVFKRRPSEFQSAVGEYFKDMKPETTDDFVEAAHVSYERRYDFTSARKYALKATQSVKERNDSVSLCNARLFLALGRWHEGKAEGPEDFQKSVDYFEKYFAAPEKPVKPSRPVKPGAQYTVTYGNNRLDFARACIGAGRYEQAQSIIDDLLSKKEYEYDGDVYSCQALLSTCAVDPTYHDLEVAKENLAIADDLGAYHENKYVHGLIELQEKRKDKAVAFFTAAAARDSFGFCGRVYRREVQRLTRVALQPPAELTPDGEIITYEYIDDDEDPPVMVADPADPTTPTPPASNTPSPGK